MIQINFRKYFFDQLLKTEFEVVSFFSLKEKTFNFVAPGTDADEYCASFGVEKRDNGLKNVPFDVLLFKGQCVSFELDGIGGQEFFCFLEGSSTANTMQNLVHINWYMRLL